MDTRIGLILTLLCASVVLAQSQSCDWTGKWEIVGHWSTGDYGIKQGSMILQQSGNSVTGSCGDYQNGGFKISGTVSGNRLTANCEAIGSVTDLNVTMADDCNSFNGFWPGPLGYDYQKYGYWIPLTGTRVEFEV
jgi:hypothetical protein